MSVHGCLWVFADTRGNTVSARGHFLLPKQIRFHKGWHRKPTPPKAHSKGEGCGLVLPLSSVCPPGTRISLQNGRSWKRLLWGQGTCFSAVLDLGKVFQPVLASSPPPHIRGASLLRISVTIIIFQSNPLLPRDWAWGPVEPGRIQRGVVQSWKANPKTHWDPCFSKCFLVFNRTQVNRGEIKL